MFRMLESQAPAKQTAAETISTLSSRLQSATLLEDRRAAILGLRSFAKLYPASVASGGLRDLINTLKTGGEDVDTTKVVLETLLMLFSPDSSSDEASDDIALWLADEFTQRQDNISALLNLLDHHDFFTRLYALQLVAAISQARPDRTQECVHTAQLGVSRLVAVLDDGREAIRTECLLLLSVLTPLSTDFQKLVAFENAFERIFKIIMSEGGLSDGGVAVQDCLSLLAALLRMNTSNQEFFRETGGIAKVHGLLKPILEDSRDTKDDASFAAAQRDKNLWGLLSIIRAFVVSGGVGAEVNQAAFWDQGVTALVIDIAFSSRMPTTIRSEALATCADLIRGNSRLQRTFAQRDIVVTLPSQPKTASPPVTNGTHENSTTMNIIQGLLDVCLNVSSNSEADLRISALQCIKAYFHDHSGIRRFFLQRVCAGHQAPEPEPDNVLTILLEDPEANRSPDVYRYWISAVILLHLIFEDYENKQVLMRVSEGDAEKGEEVVTCIQALTGNLLTRSLRGDEERICISYLMLLSAWLFEDPDAVNDFLQEGSNLQSTIDATLRCKSKSQLIGGSLAFLLGIVYEFSSKDSPVPRSTVHSILSSKLGREQYRDAMRKLRENPLVRDFEISYASKGAGSDDGDVLFDKTYMEFFKDNYSRVIRAVDRDPRFEISVNAGGVQKGISRELVDSLQSQLEGKTSALQAADSKAISLQRQLDQEQADHRRSKESASMELTRIRTINDNLQKHHDAETQAARLLHSHHIEDARRDHEVTETSLQQKLEAMGRESDALSAKARRRHAAEIADVKASLQKAQAALEKNDREHAQDLKTANDEYAAGTRATSARSERAEDRAKEAEARADKIQKAMHDAQAEAQKAKGDVQAKEKARLVAQTELDDLLIVLGDLEEKRARDKDRLKKLGEEVSDGGADSDDEDDKGEEVG